SRCNSGGGAIDWRRPIRADPPYPRSCPVTDQTPELPEPLTTLFARAEQLATHLDAPLSAATDVPRPEHPRPQLHRPTWLNLKDRKSTRLNSSHVSMS